MKVTKKIIFAILLLLLLVFCTLGAATYFLLQKAFDEKTASQLQSVLALKKVQLERYIQRAQIELKATADSSAFISDYRGFQLAAAADDETGRVRYENSMLSLLREKAASAEFSEIFVMDNSGKVIFSTDSEQKGKIKSAEPFFTQGLNGEFVQSFYYSLPIQAPSTTVSFPIKDELDNTIGVLAARVDSEKLNEVMMITEGLGATGEVYLVNGSNLLVIESKYIPGAAFKKFDYSEIAKQCVSGGSGHLHSENYRDAFVASEYEWIPDLSVCLIVSIDESEANATALVVRRSMFLISILMLIVAGIAGTLIFKKIISEPLIKLQKGTQIVEKGDLYYRMEIDTPDEFGQLAQAFDRMSESLRKSREEIDRKVESQTAEILKHRGKLEHQQNAILNVLEDIEQEKDIASQERDKINAILRTIADGVLVVNAKMKIVLLNPAAAKLSGYTESEAIGCRYDKILHFVNEEENEKKDLFIEETIKTGKAHQMDSKTIIIKKDGVKTAVADSAAPLKDSRGKVIGCVIVFRDVTKERKVEEAKTEFVSIASHQLNTPLTAIRLFIELLVDENGKNLTKKQKEYLDSIYQSTRRMVRLVNDLLNVSRLETGRMKVSPESLQLEVFLQNIIAEVQPLVEKCFCKIELLKPEKPLPKVMIDPMLLRQVVHNLISNAIRYSREKKCDIHVKVEKKNNLYMISVRDQGMGIPKDVQPKIFQKFFRTDDARKAETEGSGLGLYVAKMILDNSGGKIWFESPGKNKGTTFFVSIPEAGMREKKGEKGLAESNNHL
ncbi:PAS domain S-box protein [Patescibacteria group bacterium]|nr:PAS domain S-box protein [Patescibacteria group bacterium]